VAGPYVAFLKAFSLAHSNLIGPTTSSLYYGSAAITQGRAKKNQDAVLVRTDLAGKSMLLGVCDGHGGDGALVSSIVAATLPDAIVAEKELLKVGTPGERLQLCLFAGC
jgi:hypothetical protein